MSPRAAVGLGAAALALVLAGAPDPAVGSAAGWVGAGTEVRGADAAATPKARTAPGRCRVKRRQRVTRRVRCLRVRRLTAPAPVPERLVAAPAPAPPADAPPGGSAGDGAPAPSPAPPRFVSVSAREWSLTLSRPVVGAGSVTVEPRNVGEDPHDLVVSPDDGSHAPLAEWDETGPGQQLRRTVSLPAGRYLLFCSVEGHESAGMSARLRVE